MVPSVRELFRGNGGPCLSTPLICHPVMPRGFDNFKVRAPPLDQFLDLCGIVQVDLSVVRSEANQDCRVVVQEVFTFHHCQWVARGGGGNNVVVAFDLDPDFEPRGVRTLNDKSLLIS